VGGLVNAGEEWSNVQLGMKTAEEAQQDLKGKLIGDATAGVSMFAGGKASQLVVGKIFAKSAPSLVSEAGSQTAAAIVPTLGRQILAHQTGSAAATTINNVLSAAAKVTQGDQITANDVEGYALNYASGAIGSLVGLKTAPGLAAQATAGQKATALAIDGTTSFATALAQDRIQNGEFTQEGFNSALGSVASSMARATGETLRTQATKDAAVQTDGDKGVRVGGDGRAVYYRDPETVAKEYAQRSGADSDGVRAFYDRERGQYVLPELLPGASREQKILHGATIAHENAHRLGAGEEDAFKAMNEYAERNGFQLALTDDGVQLVSADQPAPTSIPIHEYLEQAYSNSTGLEAQAAMRELGSRGEISGTERAEQVDPKNNRDMPHPSDGYHPLKDSPTLEEKWIGETTETGRPEPSQLLVPNQSNYPSAVVPQADGGLSRKPPEHTERADRLSPNSEPAVKSSSIPDTLQTKEHTNAALEQLIHGGSLSDREAALNAIVRQDSLQHPEVRAALKAQHQKLVPLLNEPFSDNWTPELAWGVAGKLAASIDDRMYRQSILDLLDRTPVRLNDHNLYTGISTTLSLLNLREAAPLVRDHAERLVKKIQETGTCSSVESYNLDSLIDVLHLFDADSASKLCVRLANQDSTNPLVRDLSLSKLIANNTQDSQIIEMAERRILEGESGDLSQVFFASYPERAPTIAGKMLTSRSVSFETACAVVEALNKAGASGTRALTEVIHNEAISETIRARALISAVKSGSVGIADAIKTVETFNSDFPDLEISSILYAGGSRARSYLHSVMKDHSGIPEQTLKACYDWMKGEHFPELISGEGEPLVRKYGLGRETELLLRAIAGDQIATKTVIEDGTAKRITTDLIESRNPLFLGYLFEEMNDPAKRLANSELFKRINGLSQLDKLAESFETLAFATSSSEPPLAERYAAYAGALRNSTKLGISNPLRYAPDDFVELVSNRLTPLTKSLDERPVFAVIVGTEDEAGALMALANTIAPLRMAGNKVMLYEVATKDEFLNSLKDAAAHDRNGKVAQAVISGHGSQDAISFSAPDPRLVAARDSRGQLHINDQSWLAVNGFSELLDHDAKVFLISCSTGMGSDQAPNMANMLAACSPPGTLVQAPVVPLVLFGFSKHDGRDWQIDTMANLYHARAD
jgi:hypothetical protein